MFQIRVRVFYGGFKIRVKFNEDFDTPIEHDDKYLKQFLLLRNLPLNKWLSVT